jgi:lipopolysaccharide/colanic/teichoic acid biosynthesis glycosyltransferase
MDMQTGFVAENAVTVVSKVESDSNVGRTLYRVFEVCFAATAILVTLPLTLLIALVVKLGSPGPVLFFQERVGKGGKTFRFVKFRTMYVDARQRFPELYRYAYEEKDIPSLVFKIKNDPRMTPQGRWLRKTSLDELPNFWNVLTGEMALVGPRPEIPQMVPYYKGEFARKFEVLPGVTGLAQVSGRGDLTFMDTAKLDLKYIRERSMKLDFKILFLSVRAVFFASGAF